MRRRRIFRPAPQPRRWGTIAIGCAGLGLAALLAGAPPRALLGSAVPEQNWSAPAAEVSVLDGDALRLGDRVVRLDGLVVPERGTARCRTAAGIIMDCAGAAAETLARLVQGREIGCRIQGRDRLGRAMGQCEAEGTELGPALVAAGWALAAPNRPALAALEAGAREAGRGLWSGGATPPEAWRRAP
ncbi:thermonuclease family protein [Belnapia sp. T6]|uniref:Thermonuclease family protein n=1 Tax=Belnapia mucosa TaxID=2804532 RepID=A0ABS1V539_9PROT|nr:thermonuclease family protein [Belnapia mucosa]MBL6456809.1 thermonuclease family protein [Belnapia mucosa]